MIFLWLFLAAARVVRSLSFAHRTTQGMPSLTPTSKPARRSPPDTNTGNTNNMLPSSADAPNLDSFSLADELAQVADSANGTRPPDMNDLGEIAELVIAIGYYSVEDLLDASTAKRDRISALLMEAFGAFERCERFRKPKVTRCCR